MPPDSKEQFAADPISTTLSGQPIIATVRKVVKGEKNKKGRAARKKKKKKAQSSVSELIKFHEKKPARNVRQLLGGKEERERERKRARLSPALPSPEYRIQFCPPTHVRLSLPFKSRGGGGRRCRSPQSTLRPPGPYARRQGAKKFMAAAGPPMVCRPPSLPPPPPRRMCQSYLYSQKRGWGLGGIIPSLGSP